MKCAVFLEPVAGGNVSSLALCADEVVCEYVCVYVLKLRCASSSKDSKCSSLNNHCL